MKSYISQDFSVRALGLMVSDASQYDDRDDINICKNLPSNFVQASLQDLSKPFKQFVEMSL